MENSNSYSLAEVVELYCLHQFNSRKKRFDDYLPMAKFVWEDIFLRTIWNTKSKWLPLKSGDPYPFIDFTKGDLFLGVYITDDCGDLFPLIYNGHIPTLPKPAKKSCGCKDPSCNCGDLCSGMNALSYASKDVVIDNVTYQEKTWLQVCGTGEVKKWRSVPSKVYTDENSYTVAYEDQFETVCQLDVKPCGCVSETISNQKIIMTKCGQSLVSCSSKTFFKYHKHKGIPEYTFSKCGTKINIIGNNLPTDFLLHSQSLKAAMDSRVPHYCLDTMFTGIQTRSILWNPTKSLTEKDIAKEMYKDAKKDIIKFLNPVDLEGIMRIQGEPKQW
jgi:hypothetical protein